MKKKYLKSFEILSDEDRNEARKYAKKVGGIISEVSFITGVRSQGMPVSVTNAYIYPKKKK